MIAIFEMSKTDNKWVRSSINIKSYYRAPHTMRNIGIRNE
jgi:hypothetical protein